MHAVFTSNGQYEIIEPIVRTENVRKFLGCDELKEVGREKLGCLKWGEIHNFEGCRRERKPTGQWVITYLDIHCQFLSVLLYYIVVHMALLQLKEISNFTWDILKREYQNTTEKASRFYNLEKLELFFLRSVGPQIFIGGSLPAVLDVHRNSLVLPKRFH